MTALTTQGISIMCLFIVFMWSPQLVRKREGPIVAAVTVQGGAGFKDATRTMNMQNFIPS